MQIDEFYGVWTDLYADAKHEIFRLQLLDTYLVESEDKWFNAYKAGKPLPIPEDSNYFRTMERKKEEGVRILNLLVVDLPLSAYTRWVADMVYTRITEKRGQETLVVERKRAGGLTRGKTDYWMFDNSVVMPMIYDREGHFLGAGKLIEGGKGVTPYNSLKEALLKEATPIRDFLRAHNITLLSEKAKDRN